MNASGSTPPPSSTAAARRPAFVTTQWSVVLNAGRSDTTSARAALESLCRTYWYPLYAYVRRRGYSPPDAEDLTQAFFARLLASRFFADADRERGRFRSFLLTALNHFLADEWDRLKTQKRGGGQPLLRLESESAETQYHLEPADHLTPERLYEQRWARTLLARVVGQLRSEYESDGKGRLFTHLKASLTQARAAIPYASLATELQLSEGALRVAVHRLRQRYRELLHDEVAQTVAGPEEVRDELQHLFRVLGG